MTEMRAFLSRDRQTVLMTTGRWSQKIPAADAEKWRGFYRRLWGRGAKAAGQPGPYASFYEQPCRVLDALCKQIREGS